MPNTPKPASALQPNAIHGSASDTIGPQPEDRCDEALISRQRQRYLASLLSDQGEQSDSQYREQ